MVKLIYVSHTCTMQTPWGTLFVSVLGLTKAVTSHQSCWVCRVSKRRFPMNPEPPVIKNCFFIQFLSGCLFLCRTHEEGQTQKPTCSTAEWSPAVNTRAHHWCWHWAEGCGQLWKVRFLAQCFAHQGKRTILHSWGLREDAVRWTKCLC